MGDEFYFLTIDGTRIVIVIGEKTKSFVLSKLKEEGGFSVQDCWE